MISLKINLLRSAAPIVALFVFVSVQAVHAASTQTVTVKQVENRALDFLSGRLIDAEGVLEPSVRYDGSDLVLPKGKVVFDFRLPSTGLKVGRIPLSLNVKVGNHFQRRVRLQARLTEYHDIIWTRHRVKRGEILTEEDVRVENVKLDRPLRRVATRLEDVLGFEAQRNLSEGRMIPLSSLRRPPLVAKGDPVILIAQKGFMKITVPGIVRGQGFKDSLVQVLNLQTRKMVYGKVVDANTVKVNF